MRSGCEGVGGEGQGLPPSRRGASGRYNVGVPGSIDAKRCVWGGGCGCGWVGEGGCAHLCRV
jgi:hypothetical protein